MGLLNDIQQLLLKYKLSKLSNDPTDLTARELLPKFVGQAKKDRPFQQQVEEGYASIPDILRQLVGKSQDYTITGAEKLKELDPTVNPGDVGQTDPFSGKVSIGNDDKLPRSTIVHEMGHVIDRFSDSLDTPEFRDTWLKEANKDNSGDYGSINSGEGLAELLTTLILKGKPHLEDVYSTDYPQNYPKTLKLTKSNLQNLINQLQKSRTKFEGIPDDWYRK